MRYSLLVSCLFLVAAPGGNGVAEAGLNESQEAAVVRAVHARFGGAIPNPAIARIEAFRQSQGYVTATVHFEPHIADGRLHSARLAFCRQGRDLEEWNCVHTWDETFLVLAGQNEPVQIARPIDDAVLDAIVAFLHALPGNNRWNITRPMVASISSIHMAPSGHNVSVTTKTGPNSGALMSISLCDPAALGLALERAGFSHAGARSTCGMPQEQVPWSGQDPAVSDNAITWPDGGRFLLLHYAQGYAALRVLETWQDGMIEEGQPRFRGKVQVLYSSDGSFADVPSEVQQVSNDWQAKEDLGIRLPGLVLQWNPPSRWVQLASREGVIAASRTHWQDRRLLQVTADALQWFYVRSDISNRHWSAQQIPHMRLDHFEEHTYDQ